VERRKEVYEIGQANRDAQNPFIPSPGNVVIMPRFKIKCPRSGCNYYTDADNAKDAAEEMKEHFQIAHGENDIPDDLREDILGGRIKREEKAGVRYR
jgi:predicted small metal-binding protein